MKTSKNLAGLKRVLMVVLCAFYLGEAVNADPLTSGASPVHRCSSVRLGETCKEASKRNKGIKPREIKGRRIEVKRKLVIPARENEAAKYACQAHFETSYYQSSDRVNFETEIENDACAASHGEFKVRVKTIDAAGEEQTQTFPEVWSRNDANTVRIKNDYPIGADQRLIWVKVAASQATACRCEPPEAL